MAVNAASQPAADQQESLTTAYVQYGPMVYNVCLRTLGNPQAAEDAAQAVFLLYFKKASAFHMDERAPGWLHRMAQLVSREGLRAESRRLRREREAAVMMHDAQSAGEAESGEDMWRELRPKLDGAIESLPEKYRTPLLMVYLAGQPQKDVAKTLRLDDGTLRSRLSRAIERLRQKLGGDKCLSVALLGVLLEQSARVHVAPAKLLPSILHASHALSSDGGGGAAVSATVKAYMDGGTKAMFWIRAKMMSAALVAGLVLTVPMTRWAIRAAEPEPEKPIAIPAVVRESTENLLWDGHESVDDYAKRCKLPPTKTLELGNGVKMELKLIPAGKFIMGTPEPTPVDEKIVVGQALLKARAEYAEAKARYDAVDPEQKPGHTVTLTKPYYMGKYDVTQEQYQVVIGKNPSYSFKGNDNPVENVSWYDAQMFCKKATAQSKQAVRLPTEAEWEYACRAGTSTTYYSGDTEKDLDRVAWYSANSNGTTHAVGQKEPNAFGLYDMHGNVWQWCQDWYAEDYYGKSAAENPQGPTQGTYRSKRGGSWGFNAMGCRATLRVAQIPVYRDYYHGFRVAVPAFEAP